MENPVYLDYAATTPVHPLVRSVMIETLEFGFGNPSSMHRAGREATGIVLQARNQVAGALRCSPGEIYFTSGATEADNLALSGILRPRQPGRTHLITSAIEHHAILHTARQFEQEGYQVTYLPVDSQGLVDPADVRAAIRPETVLISIMLVNNEMGAIQPVAEIGKIAHEHGILIHTDAVQGMALLQRMEEDLNVDLLSLSAHKIYGPKGVGALYVKEGTPFSPLMFGGPQEGGFRPGTENVPGIAGFGKAMELVKERGALEYQRTWQLRQTFVQRLRQLIPDIRVNGPPDRCSPFILSVSFPGPDGEMMLFLLDSEGIAVSLGSACNSQSIEPSHVLSAMGLSREQLESSLRISFGFPTTEAEVEEFLERIPQIYRRALPN
jgi:cysteine desulfurase